MSELLPCPADASTRSTRRAECSLRLLLAAGGSDFRGEVAFLPFDSLAESIAHKAGHLHRRTDLALSFLERLGDRLAAVMDECLLEQADFLVEGLQARLDDLLDYVLGLALLAILVGQHVPLALDELGVEARRIDRLRVGGGDMHRKLPAEHSELVGLAGGFEGHDHAHL